MNFIEKITQNFTINLKKAFWDLKYLNEISRQF